LHFKLKSATTEILKIYLKKILDKENIQYDESSLHLITKHSGGSIRDSLSIAEQCISYCSGKITEEKVSTLLGDISVDKLEKVVSYIMKNKATDIVSHVER
jgi:DNA polymerase III, gamma/tau subunits